MRPLEALAKCKFVSCFQKAVERIETKRAFPLSSDDNRRAIWFCRGSLIWEFLGGILLARVHNRIIYDDGAGISSGCVEECASFAGAPRNDRASSWLRLFTLRLLQTPSILVTFLG